LAPEGVLREWMSICRKTDKDAMSAAHSLGATSKQDTGNPSEGVSIFSSINSDPKSCHLERSSESGSDLEQAVTSFGAFCKLMTLRLEANVESDAGQLASASESALREWMEICRETDKDAMSAAVSPSRVHAATSKQDAGNPSEGVSIFSAALSQPEPGHLERYQESHTDFEQVLTSFSAFCKSMTLRLEADEDAFAAVGSSSRPSRHLKRTSSADGRSRIQRIRTRRCSSCDGRFDCKLPATESTWGSSLPKIAM